jgi:transmembrane sensor
MSRGTEGAQDAMRVEHAAAWLARTESGEDCDWDAFTRWLEADPGNRAAYAKVAGLAAEIASRRADLKRLLPANEDAPRWAGRWRVAAVLTAAAAAAAAVAVLPRSVTVAPESVADYVTGPGERRTVTTADGSVLDIDGNTRLRLHGSRGRQVELVSGSAYFTVRHDGARPFVVTAGRYTVQDVGTRFEVTAASGRVSVAVAEGEVAVRDAGKADVQSMRAGDRLDIWPARNLAERRRVDPASVASWRSGTLVYDNAPLSLVAADMARYVGTSISVDPAVAGLRFSGGLEIGDGSRLVERLEQFVAVRAEEGPDGIRLVARRTR